MTIDSATDHWIRGTDSTSCCFMASASDAMKTLESVAREIAATNIPVLITGESGTGKQSLARRIHEMSLRREDGLLWIVCGMATPETLVSELRLAKGKPQTAGTVILDGIDELDRECQRKLLHSLPESESRLSKDVLAARLISTAAQNLEQQVRSGSFRSDLYYRVNGFSLRIPPLRERREDIPLLLDFFFAKHESRFERPRPSLSQTTIARLKEHEWSGNVRELENLVMKILAIGDEEIALADLSALPPPVNTATVHSLKAAARSASREAERELILRALERTRWNRKRAAQELQVSYKSLLYKIKQIGLPAPGGE